MHDLARLQSVIEILELYEKDYSLSFEKLIKTYLKERRYIGSKDRKFIYNKTFEILRNYYAYYNVLQTNSPRLMVALHENIIFDEPTQYGPKKLTLTEIGYLKAYPKVDPTFIPKEIKSLIKNQEMIKSLNEKAPLDLRINTLKTDREEIKRYFQDAVFTPYSFLGLRLSQKMNLTEHELFRQGKIEIQDEGSQILSILCDVQPNEHILDFCAGACGKSLTLSNLMKNTGQIIATDISQNRLNKSIDRIQRSNANNILLSPIDKVIDSKQQFDRVIIDAPCSGSGTWRRNPDLKPKTTLQYIESFTQKQKEILSSAHPFVKKGGYLIYMTCSIFKSENEKQIEWFMQNFPNFTPFSIQNIWEKYFKQPYPGNNPYFLNLDPLNTKTDGFFICILNKKK